MGGARRRRWKTAPTTPPGGIRGTCRNPVVQHGSHRGFDNGVRGASPQPRVIPLIPGVQRATNVRWSRRGQESSRPICDVRHHGTFDRARAGGARLRAMSSARVGDGAQSYGRDSTTSVQAETRTPRASRDPLVATQSKQPRHRAPERIRFDSGQPGSIPPSGPPRTWRIEENVGVLDELNADVSCG